MRGKPHRKLKLKRKVTPKPGPDILTRAFMDALMYLPDQEARGLASDVVTGMGPGAEDPKAAARVIVKAAKKVKWEHWRSLALLAKHGGVKL